MKHPSYYDYWQEINNYKDDNLISSYLSPIKGNIKRQNIETKKWVNVN